MTIEIRVPTLGESVTEATVATWFKKPGDAVAAVIAAGIIPAGLEMMDKPMTAAVEDFVHAGYDLTAAAILLCESDGTPEEVEEEIGQTREAQVWPNHHRYPEHGIGILSQPSIKVEKTVKEEEDISIDDDSHHEHSRKRTRR